MRGFISLRLQLVQWSILGLLAVANVLGFAGLLMKTDIAEALKKRSAISAAYEARIDQLNTSVSRLRFKELASTGAISLKVKELNSLQAQLKEQVQTATTLAEAATTFGALDPVTLDESLAQLTPVSIGNLNALEVIETDLRNMKQELIDAVAVISSAADEATDKIQSELNGLGYTMDLDNLAPSGPKVPWGDIVSNSASLDVGDAVTKLKRLARARRAMENIPIHRPVQSGRRSSNFGPRADPFNGRSAFHSGIDFPAPTGTLVRSAGRGTVTFVGWKTGYGKLVEVSHESGLISRYPHLSKALVTVGDQVEADMKIALVGSTGRSTGPHLHFELRDQSGAIDPAPYLQAGKRLQRFHN